ncbi:hypothetical protein [Kingella potus]|nr:hypothetical protein [Kingella potus]UOO99905.1 hypothetical protein LVJ84_07460 [Kingella potus]
MRRLGDTPYGEKSGANTAWAILHERKQTNRPSENGLALLAVQAVFFAA